MDLRDAEISEPLTKRARCVDKEDPQRGNAKRAGSTSEEEQPSRKKAKEEKDTCEGKKESEPLPRKPRTGDCDAGETSLSSEIAKIPKNQEKDRAPSFRPPDTCKAEQHAANVQDLWIFHVSVDGFKTNAVPRRSTAGAHGKIARHNLP